MGKQKHCVARTGSRDHKLLWSVAVQLPQDYTPWGEVEQWAEPSRPCGDCSSGCKWARWLEGSLGGDWCVCANPRSHRAGLLTFEHQGCKLFAAGRIKQQERELEVRSLSQLRYTKRELDAQILAVLSIGPLPFDGLCWCIGVGPRDHDAAGTPLCKQVAARLRALRDGGFVRACRRKGCLQYELAAAR